MKQLLGGVLLFCSIFLLSFETRMYSIDDVVSAMKNGNAAQLSRYLDERVDISLPGKSDNYSLNRAEMILKDFFANSSVKDFQVKHKGENDGAQFCFGVLVTKTGSYRTKLYMKNKADKQVLQEIGFQKID